MLYYIQCIFSYFFFTTTTNNGNGGVLIKKISAWTGHISGVTVKLNLVISTYNDIGRINFVH